MENAGESRKRAKGESSLIKISALDRSEEDSGASIGGKIDSSTAAASAHQDAEERRIPPRATSASGRHTGAESSDNKEEGNMEKKRDREKKRRSEITNAVERLSQTIAKIEQPRGRVDATAWNIVSEYTRNSPSSGLFPHAAGAPVATTATSASGRDADNKKGGNKKQNTISSNPPSSSFNRQQQQNRTHVISNACDLIERLHAENLHLKEQLRHFMRGGGVDGSNTIVDSNTQNTAGMSNILARPTNSTMENNQASSSSTNPSSTPSSSLSQSNQGAHFPRQAQPSSLVPILPLNDSRGQAVLRNSGPSLHQQQEGDMLQFHQLQRMRNDSQLGNPALHQHQQSLLMQHAPFQQPGNNSSRGGLPGMQNMLGGGLPPNPSGDLLNMMLASGRGPMHNQQHPMNNMAHSEPNLLMSQLDPHYQQDISLQQYLLARSLHSQRDPHSNQDSSGASGDNSALRGPGGSGFRNRRDDMPPGTGGGSNIGGGGTSGAGGGGFNTSRP